MLKNPNSSRPAWGDDDEEHETFLPETEVYGPDEKGIKTTITYEINSKGEKIKKTHKVRVVVRRKKISKGAKKRSQWERFGRFYADDSDPADDLNITFRSKEEIIIEHPDDEGKEEKRKERDLIEKLRQATRERYFREKLKEQGIEVDKGSSNEDKGVGKGLRVGTELSKAIASGRDPSSGNGKYVPPSRRGDGRSSFGDNQESNSIRVTNISEDATEKDLLQLFRHCGHVTRIYLAKDRETHQSRGFAYVTYQRREDAERAMREMNGYGYDHLILKIEWAKPSNRDNAPPGGNTMRHASGYGKALPQGL